MTTAVTLELKTISQTLGRHRPLVLPVDRGHAAVAMLLREAVSGPELLFIQRAPHERDPWSGDLGFPGGRLQPDEQDPRQAAERETREELGLDLATATAFGRLDDLYGATLPVLVSCYVYRLPESAPLSPNYEVARTFWFPLQELLNPARHHLASIDYRGRQIRHPAVDLLGADQTVLWGITYRLIRQFFAILGHEFGTLPGPIDARP